MFVSSTLPVMLSTLFFSWTFKVTHVHGGNVSWTLALYPLYTELVLWSWVDLMKLVHVDTQQSQSLHKFTLLAIPDGIPSTRRRERCPWSILC